MNDMRKLMEDVDDQADLAQEGDLFAWVFSAVDDTGDVQPHIEPHEWQFLLTQSPYMPTDLSTAYYHHLDFNHDGKHRKYQLELMYFGYDAPIEEHIAVVADQRGDWSLEKTDLSDGRMVPALYIKDLHDWQTRGDNLNGVSPEFGDRDSLNTNLDSDEQSDWNNY